MLKTVSIYGILCRKQAATVDTLVVTLIFSEVVCMFWLVIR